MSLKIICLLVIGLAVVLVNGGNHPDCGTKGRQPGKLGIINGEDAERNEFPWQGALMEPLLNVENGGYLSCGCQILNENWVLTAAHCNNPNLFRFVGGAYSLVDYDGTEQNTTIAGFYPHPDYIAETWDNDIAVVKLGESIDLSLDNLGAICLPDKEDLDQIAGQTCIGTGWGQTVAGQASSSMGNLKKANLPVWPQAECLKFITNSDENATNTDGKLCAGEGQEADCQGDSGGPLNCYIDGRWYSYGADSYGLVGCPAPNVFARVSEYSDWVWNTIEQNS